LAVSERLDNEALTLARRVAMLNGEIIYVVKNILKLEADLMYKQLTSRRDKMSVIIRDFNGKADPELLLATALNAKNHDVTKVDVGYIKECLLEGLDGSSD